MLSFFPTPYPDEWWYSVLCRYHVRTGNPKFATTINELFGGTPRATIGSLFPNNGLFDILSQLPEGLLDIEELIFKHTLFCYYLRMVPLERKEKMLADLRIGKGETVSWIWSSENRSETKLKYCPICRNEDMDIYGETYWRVNHQIPLMSICPQHNCRLKEVYVGRRTKLKEQFYTPEEYCIQVDADCNLKPYESALSKTLDAYYRLPMQVGPTNGYSNLALALSNKGYVTILKRYNITLDRQAVYQDLCNYYGPELVEQVFGREMAAIVLSHICNWILTAPDRYAMLAVMVGQTPEEMFGERIIDKLEVQLRKLSAIKGKYSKKYVAQQLGIKTHQMDALCRRYRVEPFWIGSKRGTDDNEDIQKESIRLSCTKQEKLEIEAYVKKENFASISDFLRFCVRSTITKN